MEPTFEKQSFRGRLKSMLEVDFKRMFTMPLLYVMAGVSFLLPVLVLVMTSLTGGGEEAAGFTNAWQAIGSVSGSAAGTDLTALCNADMLYFLVAVLVCVFVGDDFRSGYAKNLFAVRAGKTDYVFSKTLVTFVGATVMFAAYSVGAAVGGAVAGLSFATEGFGAGGIVACLLSKIGLAAVFVSLSLLLSVVAKRKLWLSVVGSFAAGMLLFTMVSRIAPLDANVFNVIACFAGGAVFAAGIGAASKLVLDKTDLI